MHLFSYGFPNSPGDFSRLVFEGYERLLHLGMKASHPELRKCLRAKGVAIVTVEYYCDCERGLAIRQYLGGEGQIIEPDQQTREDVDGFFFALYEIAYPQWHLYGARGSFVWRLEADTVEHKPQYL